MKILITGATGLIGKELGKLLISEGHTVVALTRDAKSAIEQLPYPAEIVEWKNFQDEFASTDLSKLVDLDAVVNLMGENLTAHRWNDAFKLKLVTSRVEGTQALIRNLSKIKVPPVWIQGSAIGYYGASTGKDPFNESSPKGQGFLADLCEKWEAAISDLPVGTRSIFMRTGVVFSHRGGAFPQMLDPLLKGIGGVIGSGEQLISMVHLSDMAAFISEAVKKESQAQGIYNLVCEETISQKDLTIRLCERLWLKPGPKIPGIALKLILGEMSELALQSQAVESTRLKEFGFTLEYPHVDPMLDEVTAWHQHPYEAFKAVSIVYTEQYIPQSRDLVFPFFAESANLEKLTPEFLNFKIKRASTGPMKQGTRILYQLKLHGVPFRWLTLIATWSPPFSFTDQQVKGPYSLWHHEHLFDDLNGVNNQVPGTLVRDWVRYELPLGKAGKLVAQSKVREDVARIFAFRRHAIVKQFDGSMPALASSTAEVSNETDSEDPPHGI